MTVRILVVGAQGRMGRLACAIIHEHAALSLAGEVTQRGTLLDAMALIKPDVVLDFTDHLSVLAHTEMILRAGVSPVIGASGLTEEDVRLLATIGSQGGIVVPNFSLSAALLIKASNMIVSHFPDASIMEAHHPKKKDAPSGTARYTAEQMARHRVHAASKHESSEVVPGALGAMVAGTPIHSLRLPGVLAEQEVRFSGCGEHMSVKHQVTSYDAYRAGIVLACTRVQSLSGLHYGLECLLT
jgi:4-hydroxy-tetrahydrodipicolinate reductase